MMMMMMKREKERGRERAQKSDVVAVGYKPGEGLLNFILKTMGEPLNERF